MSLLMRGVDYQSFPDAEAPVLATAYNYTARSHLQLSSGYTLRAML